MRGPKLGAAQASPLLSRVSPSCSLMGRLLTLTAEQMGRAL